VIDEGDVLVFLAGDSSYAEDLMLRGVIDGVSGSDVEARRTLERIRSLASERPLVFLPSHDPDSASRLGSRRVVAVDQRQAQRQATVAKA
jgi:glyoxylase-like metal-dependent hydrolase (beta-lactamase superfamily II)